MSASNRFFVGGSAALLAYVLCWLFGLSGIVTASAAHGCWPLTHKCLGYACLPTCSKRARHAEAVKREVEVLRRLRGCLNVAALQDVYEDELMVHIVLDYCSGGELHHRIGETNYSGALFAACLRGFGDMSRHLVYTLYISACALTGMQSAPWLHTCELCCARWPSATHRTSCTATSSQVKGAAPV